MLKDKLRNDIKLKRKLLSEDENLNKSIKIFENLKSLQQFKNSKTILSFISLKYEVNTRKINEYILKENKTLLLPKILKDNEMIACEYTDILKKGPFNILEPISKEFTQNIDYIIIPGLAFDLKGNRLGYGKGYYDNFLKKYSKSIKCGICFDFQLIDEIPTENHDEKVQILLTDKNILKF